MRLRLEGLGSQEIELELPPIAERKRKLRLERAVGLRGTLETASGRYRLAAIAAEEIILASGRWVFGFGGAAIDKPVSLAGVELNLEVGEVPAFAGTISAQGLDAAALAFDFGAVRLSGDLRLERLRVEHGAEGDGQATAARLVARDLQLTAGGVLVRAGALAAESVLVRWGSGSWTVAAAATTLKEATVTLAGVEVQVGEVEAPRGLTVSADEIRGPELAVGEARIELADLAGLYGGGDGGGDSGGDGGGDGGANSGGDGARAQPAALDLRILDRLNGRLDVDLTLDATVPVIGRRRATHHFRIPIHDGTINYRQLERDLSLLENAVLDFKVRGSRLVLERDLILPGMNKPILIWDLNEVELALAKERIVRLRTIPSFRVAGSGQPSEEKKSRFALRRADFDNIDLAVAINQPRQGGALAGWIRDARAENLSARGAIHYDGSGEEVPTSLALNGRGIGLGFSLLPAVGYLLSIEALEIGALEDGSIELRGFRPGRLGASLREARARAVRLTRKAAAEREPHS